MKINLLALIIMLAGFTTATCQSQTTAETSGGWVKFTGNPVLGGPAYGSIFDISVLKGNDGAFRMYTSWRDQKSIALSESKDGLKWTSPRICLPFDPNSDWDKEACRPVVIQKDGIYHMWYCSMIWVHGADDSWTPKGAWIGYATSPDGKDWKRMSDKPVLSPELPWEKKALLNPHVIWDEQEKIFKMWYSAGEQWEPNAIGYATSKDGLHWEKYKGNPIFQCNKQVEWEKDRVAACQVIKRKNDYLMFYIGYKNIEYAQIGMARSKDGITNWERYTGNPIVWPGSGWDASATYKPYAVADSVNNRWLLYYNGRNGNMEQIGAVVHEGMDLGF
jgi:predicted GH43/DUF377 family glycosyl hydrolase